MTWPGKVPTRLEQAWEVTSIGAHTDKPRHICRNACEWVQVTSSIAWVIEQVGRAVAKEMQGIKAANLEASKDDLLHLTTIDIATEHSRLDQPGQEVARTSGPTTSLVLGGTWKYSRCYRSDFAIRLRLQCRCCGSGDLLDGNERAYTRVWTQGLYPQKPPILGISLDSLVIFYVAKCNPLST